MNQIAIIPDRLAAITSLAKGSHDPAEGLMCIMEAEAYIAGEPWSDTPECVCPVIGAFMRSWNDGLNQEDRDHLVLPFKGRFIGTRSTKEVEHNRSLMATDWLVRTYTPAWLRLAGLTSQADALASLPEITAMAQVPSIRGTIEAVRNDATAAWDAAGAAAWDAVRDAAGAAAWDAVRDAAGAAAWDAVRDAAGDAAWAAAGDAARVAARDAAGAAARTAAGDAAWAAAGAAAGAAAWAAAGDAARVAARAKLRPTVEHLQVTVVALIERMIAA